MAVDLGPRKFLPPDKKLAKSLLQPYEPFPLSHRIKLSVDELKRDLFPMAVNPRTPEQQLEQLSLLAGDADPFELHKMSWGITFTTDDGSRAVFRFKNREGSRASSIKKSRRYIRDTSRRGARHFKRVLRLAKKLASGGTTVVLLRMPLAGTAEARCPVQPQTLCKAATASSQNRQRAPGGPRGRSAAGRRAPVL